VGQSNLWLSTVDGRERKPLIPGKVAASEPAVSADGRFVVFVSQRGNSRNLWRIDIDGANLRQVTSGQYDWHLALSPDGKWVAYESRDAGQRALWKAPLGEAGSPVNWLTKRERRRASRLHRTVSCSRIGPILERLESARSTTERWCGR